MRNALRISLIAQVCLVGFLAMSARMTANAGAPPPSDEERMANAHATLVKADVEALKAQTQWLQTCYQVRKMAAETAKIMQEVRSMNLDNQLKTCDTFFKKRERREQYKSQHVRTRPDRETYVRICSASKPKKLLKYQFDPDRGRIFWPELLQKPEFEQFRQELDALFVPGSAQAGLGMGLQHRVDTLSRQMQSELRGMVRDVSLMEYAAAKSFIRSLAYEARFVPQLGSVAANN